MRETPLSDAAPSPNGFEPVTGPASAMGSLFRLPNWRSRSISPENFTGAKGKGGMAMEGAGAERARRLGRGWKISPRIFVQPQETCTIADIKGPGMIQQIWLTASCTWRFMILRIYWDDQEHPSVECPLGDFFGCGWNSFSPLSSLAVCVNPGSAFNCYWQMPFARRCRITLTNLDEKEAPVFYQINYALTRVPDECACFHASFRRTNPLPYKEVYTILDNVRGNGQYVGTYMAWGSNNSGWWGEGEIKFYLDGDEEFPTICGTGTEDYFCGSYNFENKQTREYQAFSTPYAGLHQVLRPDGLYRSQMRFGMYRWHIVDPIRFEEDIRVTIQALGWRSDRTYLPLQDDIASVAYWYQQLPSVPFAELPGREELEVI